MTIGAASYPARSMRDKIAIAVDCDLAPVGELNVVSELVREGIIVFVERAVLSHLYAYWPSGEVRRGLNADVYKLTEKGIALCDFNGIKRK